MSARIAAQLRCVCVATLCMLVAVCLVAAPAVAHGWTLADAFGDGLDEAASSGAEHDADSGAFADLPAFQGDQDEEAADEEVAPEEAVSEDAEVGPGDFGAFADRLSADLDPAPVALPRPTFSEFYAGMLAEEGEELPVDSDDPVWQAALSAEGYEVAGLLIWLPQDFETIAFDEVMVTALDGDFYVDAMQVSGDFEAFGGETALIEYLVEIAAEDETAELLLMGDEGSYTPLVGAFDVKLYGVKFTEDESVFFSFYVPTLDGGLVNLWFDVPVNDVDADYYGELVEFIASSVVYVEEGSDPVDVAAMSAVGRFAESEVVTSDGVTFSVPGMPYDTEVEGWASYDDAVVYVTTYADCLDGYDSVSEDDLEWLAASMIEEDGFYAASGYFDNGGTVVYVYVGLSYDGYLEVYGFVPMEDGSVTLIAGLCDAYDVLSLDLMAAVFQSIVYADGVPEALITGEGLIEESSSDTSTTEFDLSYLADNAVLV